MNKRRGLQKAVNRVNSSLKGFTLVELLIVVAILITLVSIAIPTYTKAKDRSLQKGLLANLKLIAAAEKIYRMENTDYIACSCSTTTGCNDPTTGCNSLLRLSLSAGTGSTYTVTTQDTGGAPGSYTATVTAAGLWGSGCTYTLDSADFGTKDYTTSPNCI